MGSCIGFCCCSLLCCECNFAIFPAPSPSYTKQTAIVSYFTNSHGHEVPYLELKTQKPRLNVIYFHGNAEDIIYSLPFLEPIQNLLDANVYSMQYPTYGTYDLSIPGRISNLIKSNTLQFYDHLTNTKSNIVNTSNTLVIGRSIGSGGACYLASHKNIQNLAVISPFSTIPSVAGDFAGCTGRLLMKEHFNNVEEIQNFNGRLLIIHGRMDEVIAFRHGEQLAEAYKKNNKKVHNEIHNKLQEKEEIISSGELKFVAPNNMTHNYFHYDEDILMPLQQFAQPMQKNTH